MKKRFVWDTVPAALKENTVCGKNYRFSVLTSRLIRLEYDESGLFEDRATQSVFFRNFKKVNFSAEVENDILVIETADLILTYDTSKNSFSKGLSIKLINEPASNWNFGEEFEDLGGTRKTLDAVNGAIPLESGLCSRNGFSIMDDSARMVLDDNGFVNVRRSDIIDVYFFGYGYNYLEAVKDYYRLTGIPPLLPAYALGNWWSRFYKYKQQEYLDLMNRFKEEDVPFSVCVIDMDWHIVDIPQELNEKYSEFHKSMAGGWTGYSWNRELFPDYKEFLHQLKSQNYYISLNLHPAQGVRKHEDMFVQMAKAMGIDETKTDIIPFDILDENYMEKYFDILHHPYEEDGVDFWWMDWQQGKSYWWKHGNNENAVHDPREALDPLWLLNHLHILDIKRDGKRPMFFSRYSGPGSQRYPVGFSGDTVISWDTLNFQPYFTATSSNIGYSWWSHDIGGHFMGYRDDELLIRWIQLGVFSPINRLHSGAYETLRKEPWYFDSRISGIIKNTLRLRHKLFPYIYTMNYRNHSELIPLITPMYYNYPKNNSAYTVPNQYFFGSEIFVAPITEKSNQIDGLGKTNVWLPKGIWFDMFSGTKYVSKNQKGRMIQAFRPLEDYPVFAKSGAIIPVALFEEHEHSLFNCDNLQVLVFPGADNEFTLYEDEGETNRFEDGHFATTKMVLSYKNDAKFVIEPAKGDTSLIPGNRNWTISLRGFVSEINISVLVNGKNVEFSKTTDLKNHTPDILVSSSTTDKVEILISGEKLIHDNEDKEEKWLDILQRSQIGYDRKKAIAEIIRDKSNKLHTVLTKISGQSQDEQHLSDALKEILTLENEQYEFRVDN